MNRDTLKQRYCHCMMNMLLTVLFLNLSKCLIITNSEEASLECDGIPISVIPAWKWLLETP